ncbi:HNH endonuclease [Labrys sp. WJW]|uniref:HNH endonuclease n=1 Tax=Labrys sp. WJW TaxID=1737983 RepID=UPI0009EF3BB0|nr:HNH endonuclease [Labrys sp. WJW]
MTPRSPAAWAAQGFLDRFQRRQRLSALMERDHGVCFWCERRVSIVKVKAGQRHPKHAATEDHVIPKVKGGADVLSNLVLSCWRCNNERGGMDAEAFLELRSTQRRAGRVNVCEAVQ